MCPATRAGQAGEEDQAPDLTWPVSMGHEFSDHSRASPFPLPGRGAASG